MKNCWEIEKKIAEAEKSDKENPLKIIHSKNEIKIWQKEEKKLGGITNDGAQWTLCRLITSIAWFFTDIWLSKINMAISLMSPISRSIVSAIFIWYSKYCLKLKN